MNSRLPPLVSVEALAGLLDDPDVLVLDTTWAMDPSADDGPRRRYEEAHIPGARFLDFGALRDPESPFHDTVGDEARVQRALRGVGLTDQHVVCVAQGLFTSAARVFWMLRLFGHDKVSVLDGGMKAWVAAGLPTEAGPSEPASGSFAARPRPALRCDLAGMQHRGNAQLIDARPPDVFSGERDFFAATDSPARGTTGHIAGATNIPSRTWTNADAQGRLRSEAELRSILEALNLAPERETITTCSLGVGASGAAFVLYLLGNHDVSVFDGSWEEWATSLSRTPLP